MHWKKFQDPGIWLGPQDFQQDKTVTIARVEAEKDNEGKTCMAMYFSHKGKELPRKLHIPKSVRYGLVQTFGSADTDDWIGKDVTLFAAKCLSFGQEEECVRVRFDERVTNMVFKWLKKKKVSPKVYMITD